MRRMAVAGLAVLALAALLGSASADAADNAIESVVEIAVQSVMQEHDIPGMAVAVTVRGQRYFFNYGVASKKSGKKVSEDTLFEIGSISKTFTATLGAYAQVRGTLSLSDSASNHLPALAGSSFDGISLLDLATYTAGGLPLQFPSGVTDESMVAYFKNWRPDHAPGTHRRYSNPSIGLFGHLAARSMGEPFDDLMEEKLFPMLGLSSTYIRVPKERMGDYAYGYAKNGKPVRANPGVLDSEAYGVKTRAADLIRFVEANMDSSALDESLRRAIAATQTGYYTIGPMTQGLGWEMYDYPAEIGQLVAGNSPEMAGKPQEAIRLDPPRPPRRDVLVNKTGSTNGFGAYVAFVPGRGIGIVMLANRYYPNAVRVGVADKILTALDRPR